MKTNPAGSERSCMSRFSSVGIKNAKYSPNCGKQLECRGFVTLFETPWLNCDWCFVAVEVAQKGLKALLKLKAEVEETLKRIQSQKGVQGIIVVNSEGIPIKSTMDNSTTIQYAGLMHSFIMKARSTVRDIDPQNDLTFLRIRSKKNEIMVAPDKDYFLIVIQNPTE
nr:PREDICTED: dynein light chain roadblock-type 1 [Opisthocomus hoazin]